MGVEISNFDPVRETVNAMCPMVLDSVTAVITGHSFTLIPVYVGIDDTMECLGLIFSNPNNFSIGER